MEHDFSIVKQQLFDGVLNDLEQERKTYVRKFWFVTKLVLLGTIVFAGLGFVFMVQKYPFVTGLFILSGVIFLIGIIAMIVKHSSFSKGFVIKFKEQVIPFIAKKYDERLEYFPTQGMMSEYNASRMFPKSYDRHKAEDTFRGQFDQTTFSFGEVFTEYKTVSTDSKGRRKETWHTIFRGIFFTSDFHKNFSGETFVDVDNMERMFGKLGRRFQKWNSERSGDLIKMENPEFEKIFAVYSTDEQECRYILTPSMMERMVGIQKKMNSNVAFSFRNNHLYVAVTKYEDFFEPRIYRTLFKEKEYKMWWDLLISMSQIVEDLNLNTRIWTRQ